ncbi:MAG TPA: MFS transporter [Streptosporangiaceae bacterium]|nr:MFS transporter [Streptosporangiaceae bacterium]
MRRRAATPPPSLTRGSTGWRRAGRPALIPLAALAATTMLAQGDQSSLAQAVSGIQHQFHVSDQLLGLIPFCMAICGGIGAIPIGVLADRHRRTWLLAAVCAIWAAAMGAGVLAAGFVVLFAARMVAGAAEGTPPVSISLLSDYFPVRRRSEAMGIYQAGAIAGAALGLVGGGVAVQLGGWQWAFWIWVPIGLLVAAWFLFLPEPSRGDQDAAFEATVGTAVGTAAGAPAAAAGTEVHEAADLAASGLISLPEPRRSGLDRAGQLGAGQLGALRELLRIPTMWFGTLFFTVSQLLLNGLSFWGVEYFKRVHHLGPAAAGGFATVLGAGSAVGILTGGMLADRLLRRGYVNARVYVAAFGAIGATLVLVPAFASTKLAVSAPLLFVGGVLLTLPIAPAEALCTDVVLPELRGRGAMIRQIVRTGSWAGPYLIGLISDLIAPNTALGLRWAIVTACPFYALGGLIMLGAARYYPRDIAYVIAHSRRASAAPAAGSGPAA